MENGEFLIDELKYKGERQLATAGKATENFPRQDQ
jgi:hypothetical protein